MPERETLNVSMSAEHRAFIKSQVAAGRFRNDSEVVRAGLRLLEEQERQRRLEEMLLEGLDGEAIEVSDRFWDDLRRRVLQRRDQQDRETA